MMASLAEKAIVIDFDFFYISSSVQSLLRGFCYCFEAILRTCPPT